MRPSGSDRGHGDAPGAFFVLEAATLERQEGNIGVILCGGGGKLMLVWFDHPGPSSCAKAVNKST